MKYMSLFNVSDKGYQFYIIVSTCVEGFSDTHLLLYYNLIVYELLLFLPLLPPDLVKTMEETSSHNLSSLPRANRHTKEYRIGKHVHYLARDGRGYPHLHRIFKKRLFAGVPDLSRCAHDIQIIYKDKSISSKARSDSEPYQYHAELNNWWYARKQADDTGIDITHAIPTWRKDCCDQIHQRFIIYGIIGSGSKYISLDRSCEVWVEVGALD